MGPPEPYLENRARNENNIVLKLGFGPTGFLFTGDAEAAQERHLLEMYGDRLNVTVLRAGRHGSNTSTSAALLDATTPKAVVISSDYESQYGHPHAELLRRLAERGISAYWTATHGNIALVSNGEDVTIKTQWAAPTASLELRDGAAVVPGTDGALDVRGTISAEGNPTHSPTAVADGGRDTSESSLTVADIHTDASGDDNQNLNDEYIILQNTGETTLELSGLTITDAAGHTYTFPDGFTLKPTSKATVLTGSGRNTNSNPYWGAESAAWNNGGDTIIVRDDEGTRILIERRP